MKAVAAAGSSEVAVVAVEPLTDVEAVEPTDAKRRKVSDPEEAMSFHFSYCDRMKRTKGWGASAKKINYVINRGRPATSGLIFQRSPASPSPSRVNLAASAPPTKELI